MRIHKWWEYQLIKEARIFVKHAKKTGQGGKGSVIVIQKLGKIWVVIEFGRRWVIEEEKGLKKRLRVRKRWEIRLIREARAFVAHEKKTGQGGKGAFITGQRSGRVQIMVEFGKQWVFKDEERGENDDGDRTDGGKSSGGKLGGGKPARVKAS